MSARTFEELWESYDPDGTSSAADKELAHNFWRDSRAALLAATPDVWGLVDDIVTAARLTQFYEDPRYKPWSEQTWKAVDTARRTISTKRKLLTSLAAQLAECEAEHLECASKLHEATIQAHVEYTRAEKAEVQLAEAQKRQHMSDLNYTALEKQLAEREAECERLRHICRDLIAAVDEESEEGVVAVAESARAAIDAQRKP